MLSVLATAACTGSNASPRRTSTTVARRPAIRFELAGAEVQGPGPPAFPDDARAAVLDTLNRWLSDAVVGPLVSGRPAPDLTPIFTAATQARLSGPDRAALVDEGLPPATRGLRSEAAAANLTALAGADGVLAAVSARIDLRLRALGDGPPLRVDRQGELVMVPDSGNWKIDGYDVRVSRDSEEGPSTSYGTGT